jgi:single-stranded DNA-binding protein
MTPVENTEEQPSDKPRPPIEIGITPDNPEQAVFRKTPEGGYTIFLRGEIQLTIHPPVAHAAESLVPDAETPQSGLLPESTSEPVTEPHSAAESTASEEGENRKFELVGNPVRDPSYRERKSGKRIADFVLATHPEEEKTEYWRIRAFDKQAERVRDQVRKGQTGVEATVYGPKQWKSRKKTKDGTWEETEVTGYYAGFVKVPKKYRSQEQAVEQQPQQKD